MEKNNKDKINKWNKENRGLLSYYRACYRAQKKNATPNWVNKKELKKIYELRPKGMEVDHIIPLQNDMVCGLHVPCNLQYLSISDNRKKRNKFSCSVT